MCYDRKVLLLLILGDWGVAGAPGLAWVLPEVPEQTGNQETQVTGSADTAALHRARTQICRGHGTGPGGTALSPLAADTQAPPADSTGDWG